MFRSASPVILTYHHIGSVPAEHRQKPALFVSPELFDLHLQWLARHRFAFLSLDELLLILSGQMQQPRRSVAVTFDDGFTDNFAHAMPLLQKHGAKAAFFITTGDIGRKDHNGFEHMDGNQIRQLHEAGMTIGSHTMTHPWLAKLGREEARAELHNSKASLEEIISRPVEHLCYPSGSFNNAVVAEAQAAGYRSACSVIRDNRVLPHQIYWMPRIMMMHDTQPSRFPYLFSWLYHAIHSRKNHQRWGNRL